MSKIQNIDVRFNATSNFGKVQAELTALRGEAAALGKTFQERAFATPPEVVNPTRWKVASAAVHEASRVYRDAASSSGLLSTQQIRATSEAEKYTKALQKQELSFSQMVKHRGIMKQVYQDQLRYQRMTAQYWGTDMQGRAITDISIPRNVPVELNTMAQNTYKLGTYAASAGKQFINVGKNIQWTGRQLTVGLTYPMALFGAAAGVMAYKVEDAFGAINKVYDVSAKAQTDEAQRAKELGDLRVHSMTMAKSAAQEYGSSITSTLAIEQELAAAGVNMSNGLLDMTKNVQRISAIGDMDSSQTAKMVIALGTAFKLSGGKMTDTLNYMNAASNATSLSLQDIAEAVPRAASSMSALGVNAKQMTVLLVSMREAGVDAAEGANALKSATGTILAPSPAALNFAKEIAGGKIADGIKNIAKSSGGNLYIAMKQLFELTRGLSNLQRQQILVKLFGKYQFNRVSAMIQDLGAAFDGTANQTKKAMDLMGRSASENAKEADASLHAMTDTASGRLKRAWETLKGELADTGKIFLTIATSVVKAATNITQFFNGLPSGAKKLALIVAGVGAIAGPVVMLMGLFTQLGGLGLVGIGKLAKGLGLLLGAQKLVTKEEQAARLTADAQNKAYLEQGTKVSTLADEIAVLTAAYEKATIAAREFAAAKGLDMGGGTAAAPMPVIPKKTYGPELPPVPVGTPISYSYARGEDPEVARAAAMRQAQMTEANRLNTESALARQAERENMARTAISKNTAAAAASGTVMALSMATMMTTSNGVANNIAKWAMIGSIAAPAMGALARGGNSLVGSIGKSAAAFKAANVGVTGLSAGMGIAKAGAMGFGTALNAALGPIGWAVIGITAIVTAFSLIKGHEDKIKAEQEALLNKQIEANKALENSTASIATNMGKAAGSYKQIVAGTKYSGAVGGTDQSNLLKSYNYYKSTDDGKQQLTALQDSNGQLLDTDKLMDKVRQKFVDLQVLGGDTAKQAKTEITGMLIAAGASSQQATQIAADAYKHLGDIAKNSNWTTPIKDQIKSLRDIAGQNPLSTVGWDYTTGSPYATEVDPGTLANLQNQATKLSDFVNQAVATSANPQQAKKYIDQFMNAALQEWNRGFDTIMQATGDGTDKARDVFTKYGITSGKAFSDAWAHNADFKKDLTDLIGSPSVWSSGEYISAATKAGETWEQAFIKPFATSSGIADNINNVADALKGLSEIPGLMPKKDEINNLIGSDVYKNFVNLQSLINSLKQTTGNGGLMSWLYGGGDKGRAILNLQNQLNGSAKALLPIVNEINKALGFRQGKTATQALKFLMNEVAASTDDADGKVKKLDGDLGGLPVSKNIRIDITGNLTADNVKTAMTNVMDQMASSYQANFNAGWDRRMQAVQNAQQSAQTHLQNHQQDVQDAFDARWEKRKDAVTAAYQKRIDTIQREIKAEQDADARRQKMFENEKARLQALADMQNNTIDYNTAINQGHLDEAAKLVNNSTVKSASDQMDAEEKNAAAAMQTRIDALNKKNDQLEKQRDKELKQLEKMEARMRKHLERIQAARSQALQREQADYMQNLQARRDAEEANMQAQLDTFKSWIPKNAAQLRQWTATVMGGLNGFGKDLTNKGLAWSVSISTELKRQILNQGLQAASDASWKNAGQTLVDKFLKGIGFNSRSAFFQFIRKGTAPTNSDNGTQTNHGGGEVGAGSTGRGGIPGSWGLHRSEQMVRAQKGEYIINRKDAQRNMPLLKHINNGGNLNRAVSGVAMVRPTEGVGPGRPTREGLGGNSGYAAMSGYADASITSGILQGFAKSAARQNAKAVKRAERAAAAAAAASSAGGAAGPGVKSVTPPPGTDPRGAAAIRWASNMIGTTGWYNRCLSFVRQSFGAQGIDQGAKDSWYQAKHKYSIGDYSKVPAGVPVWWTHGANGHVILSTGGGRAIGTDHPYYNSVGPTTIASVASWLGGTRPVGWSADINGKEIYPALRRGGHIRYDNTIANLHKGETVLTSRLTKKFEDSVASGGGDRYDITIDLRGAMVKENVDIEKAVYAAIDKRESSMGRRRVVK